RRLRRGLRRVLPGARRRARRRPDRALPVVRHRAAGIEARPLVRRPGRPGPEPRRPRPRRALPERPLVGGRGRTGGAVTYAIGIDVGTTFSAAATWRDGRAETVTLGDRAATVPSVLFLRDDGVMLVGEAAVRRAVA